MTKREAVAYVKRCDENDGPESEAEAAKIFEALYGRKPDAQDRRDGIWNHCCAYVG